MFKYVSEVMTTGHSALDIRDINPVYMEIFADLGLVPHEWSISYLQEHYSGVKIGNDIYRYFGILRKKGLLIEDLWRAAGAATAPPPYVEVTTEEIILLRACEALEKWIKLYYKVEDFRKFMLGKPYSIKFAPDEIEDLKRLSSKLYELGYLPEMWMISEPFANTLTIAKALDLKEGDPVIEIGPYSKLRYIALAAVGHPVLVVEEPNVLSDYKDEVLFPFLTALEELEPEIFGKARGNITFVGADILTQEGRGRVEAEWNRIRAISGVRRAGSAMAFRVFSAKERPEYEDILNIIRTGVFRKKDVEKSLEWIVERLTPRVILLSDPDEKGEHDLWNPVLGPPESSIELPEEIIEDIVFPPSFLPERITQVIASIGRPFKPLLTRYRLPDGTPPPAVQKHTGFGGAAAPSWQFLDSKPEELSSFTQEQAWQRVDELCQALETFLHPSPGQAQPNLISVLLKYAEFLWVLLERPGVNKSEFLAL
ncbi:hypothetical protein FJZ33_13725, partial [Candidatus Poribacteria bacterium]|nr:hypothetical protein [Candidatus Poribacteria bacterium]